MTDTRSKSAQNFRYYSKDVQTEMRSPVTEQRVDYLMQIFHLKGLLKVVELLPQLEHYLTLSFLM